MHKLNFKVVKSANNLENHTEDYTGIRYERKYMCTN
jgi:hypothetical protein